jgi:hypothetical protein
MAVVQGLAEGNAVSMTERLRDIRELSDDPEAYRDELHRRWTGLLSYRYLGRRTSSMNLGEDDDTIVTIRHDMRNPAGGLMISPLAVCTPQGCEPDIVSVPNPVIHTIQVLDPGRGVDRVEILPMEMLHRGKTLLYSRTVVRDASNPERVIAYVDGQGVRIGTPPPGLERMDVEGANLEIHDSPDLPPLWTVFGAYRRDDGHWMLPELSAEFASPDAALHLGPQHVALEAAALDASRSLIGTDMLQVQSWHVMFLARGKVGPFRVEASANAGVGRRVGVRMVIHDEGQGDREVTSAAAVLEVVG